MSAMNQAAQGYGSCENAGNIPPCDNQTCKYESVPCHNEPDCGLCAEPLRKARCVPLNYVEKVCPIIPKQSYAPSPFKMDHLTTYRSYYVPKCLEKTPNYRPKPKFGKTGKFSEEPSEYNYSYVPYKVLPYQKPAWAKKEEFRGVEGVFNGVSTYKASFQPLCGRPAKLSRPKPYYDPNRGPFDDLTTYRMQFTPHCHERVCSFKPESPYAGSATLGSQPFQGITMYKSSYIPPCATERVQSYKPKPFHRALDYAFEEDTTYTEAYRPYAFQRCTPVIKKDCYNFEDLKL